MKPKYIDSTFHYLQGDGMKRDPIYEDYRGEWVTRPLDRDPGEYPIHVDVETTTYCNLACKMCFMSFDPPIREYIGRALVYDIIDEISGESYSMKFQYRGEPLIDLDVSNYIEYAKRKGITEVMINTNANLLCGDVADKILFSGLDKLICSVEGSNRDVYNQTRIGGDFDLVVSNISTFIERRDKMGYSKPLVRVQMVRTENNAEDVDKFLSFWGDIVDEVAVEDELDYKADITDTTELKEWACPQLYQRLIVLVDGDIVPCCRAIKGGTEKQVVIGNISDTTIKQAWNGEIMRELRNTHERGKSHEVDMCARCGIRKDMVRKVGL